MWIPSMNMKRLILMLCVLACACAVVDNSTHTIKGSGIKTSPPWGYEDLCAREPTNPMCGKKK
jgi:predicted transglutaminase-like cysteine proteinase